MFGRPGPIRRFLHVERRSIAFDVSACLAGLGRPPITTPPLTIDPINLTGFTLPQITTPPITTPPLTIDPINLTGFTLPQITTPPITTPPLNADGHLTGYSAHMFKQQVASPR